MKSPKTNSHVTRLSRYLPFSVAHDQIYEEYQTEKDSISLDTIALGYIQKALKEGARCIVLTGDAGHGKTHLCKRLLCSHLDYESETARQLLTSECNGHKAIYPASNIESRPLRIHKDFSEIAPDIAAEFIEDYGNSPNETLILCANEGRLRAVISSSNAGRVCTEIMNIFHESFETGKVSNDGHIHIVNLNFQSISSETPQSNPSLLRETIKKWVVNKSRWVGCESCSLATNCPIKRNASLLSTEDISSSARINKFVALSATLERMGQVITIREMLMMVSYVVTGGLTCRDVLKKIEQHGERGWQHEYAFYNLFFDRPADIPKDRLHKGIPVIAKMAQLDPGGTAIRSVDENLLNRGDIFPEGQLDLTFSIRVGGEDKLIDAASGIDDVIGTPQSKADLAREEESVKKVVSSLRRRDFFDTPLDSNALLARLGFRHGDSFLALIEGLTNPHDRVKLKNLIVAGLHGIQGLRLLFRETSLLLVDPAFGKAESNATIIARRISISDIDILQQQSAWNLEGEHWGLPNSVDWIDRTIVFRIKDRSSADSQDLRVDLMAFECIARSASGFLSESFYVNELSRIRAFLGRLAQSVTQDYEKVALFMDGSINDVSLDEGVIQVSGGK